MAIPDKIDDPAPAALRRRLFSRQAMSDEDEAICVFRPIRAVIPA